MSAHANAASSQGKAHNHRHHSRISHVQRRRVLRNVGRGSDGTAEADDGRVDIQQTRQAAERAAHKGDDTVVGVGEGDADAGDGLLQGWQAACLLSGLEIEFNPVFERCGNGQGGQAYGGQC